MAYLKGDLKTMWHEPFAVQKQSLEKKELLAIQNGDTSHNTESEIQILQFGHKILNITNRREIHTKLKNENVIALRQNDDWHCGVVIKSLYVFLFAQNL